MYKKGLIIYCTEYICIYVQIKNTVQRKRPIVNSSQVKEFEVVDKGNWMI